MISTKEGRLMSRRNKDLIVRLAHKVKSEPHKIAIESRSSGATPLTMRPMHTTAIAKVKFHADNEARQLRRRPASQAPSRRGILITMLPFLWLRSTRGGLVIRKVLKTRIRGVPPACLDGR